MNDPAAEQRGIRCHAGLDPASSSLIASLMGINPPQILTNNTVLTYLSIFKKLFGLNNWPQNVSLSSMICTAMEPSCLKVSFGK